MMVHPGSENLVTQVIKQGIDGSGVTDHIGEQWLLPINVRSKAVGSRDLKQRRDACQLLRRPQNAVDGLGIPQLKSGALVPASLSC